MKLIFCGTPQFAVPTLKHLLRAGHEVPLVVTQPDRPKGRGGELAAPPVKQAAEKLGLAITQPEKIKHNAEFRAQLEALAPRAIIVVGYGRIIPQWMIDLPPLGNLNVHASLLPKYRGAAPIQWAIANGETTTGVTTMRIDAGLDTGDILLQAATPIRASDTAVTFGPRLAELGAALLIETLQRLDAGTLVATPQNDAQSSQAPILTKNDGLIDWQRTAIETWNRLRGFQPWPGAYTSFRGKSLQLTDARPMHESSTLQPGELSAAGGKLVVGCGGASALEVLELQPEAKRKMTAADFINGYRLAQPLERSTQPGERFGG
ncbi:MAG: methionyl-tRNA formyltransferase [Acidobacteriota bacterium]|nr:methionyl-tRNA formyltransferase [Acidobacteriota bacterium]